MRYTTRETLFLFLATTTLMVFCVPSAQALTAENYGYELFVHDFDSDEVLMSVRASYFPLDNVWTAPISWPWDNDADNALTIGFVPAENVDWIILPIQVENANLLKVWVDYEDGILAMEIKGPSGNQGGLEVTVPHQLISSLESVEISLDNQPVEFMVENKMLENYLFYVFRAEFTLSARILMVDFGLAETASEEELPSEERQPQSEPQPPSIALLAVVVTAVVMGAAYWLKLRK